MVEREVVARIEIYLSEIALIDIILSQQVRRLWTPAHSIKHPVPAEVVSAIALKML